MLLFFNLNRKRMDLKTQITLNLNGNDYIVKFPTVGQFIQIEAQKSLLTRNQYGALIVTGTKVATKALDFVDMIAYFSVLIPEIDDIKKDAKVDLFSLDILDAKEMLKVYTKEFKPWLDSWMKVINTVDEE